MDEFKRSTKAAIQRNLFDLVRRRVLTHMYFIPITVKSTSSGDFLFSQQAFFVIFVFNKD